ncbi:hypothetical protein [Blastomonas sp. CCH1-A6]|uniref:hypothetical protein n=1 Tax=Blastomonas sp. CCH1-A6 TaxID=1768762 RepID=UPI0008347616
MTEEFGPPIAVNGKRPEWLGDDDKCLPFWHDEGWYKSSKGSDADCVACWHLVTQVRLRADHPYYQSAEYKASVAINAADLEKAWDEEERWEGDFNRPDLESVIKRLEAAGYTVTPPSVRANVRSTVVPVWALDRAANMAGWDCWDAVHRDNDFLRDSIIAHAETITKHVTPPDPLAGDREFIAGMWLSADWDASAEAYRAGHLDDYVRKIMAYLRANKGRL